MKQAFIIHGLGGSREENWFEWLDYKLTVSGYSVEIPQFPTPHGQSLDNWLEVFDGYTDMITEETILVGHSIGATFVLRVLELLASRKATIAGAYLVSPVMDVLNKPEFDEPNSTFIAQPFNWEAIQSASQSFTVFHGDNDPYVPIEQAEYLADSVAADLYVIEQGGHLNTAAGYTEFPDLFAAILNE